jgi:hypothetical protein
MSKVFTLIAAAALIVSMADSASAGWRRNCCRSRGQGYYGAQNGYGAQYGTQACGAANGTWNGGTYGQPAGQPYSAGYPPTENMNNNAQPGTNTIQDRAPAPQEPVQQPPVDNSQPAPQPKT